MFAKAARNFLRDIDAGGELIPVSSLNDSDKAQLLAMVVKKKKRFWFWQKPKYEFPSCVCLLGNVLTEEEPVNPVVVESEFVKYEEKCDDVKLGAVDAGFVTVQGNIGGTEKIESRSSFGTLRKQEVDMQHLMKDVQDRKINLDHPFIQQLHENKNDILCVIKERIVTTQECVISQQTQISETCTLGAKGKTVTASVTEGGNFKDENTVLEIPTNTTVAYGVVELSVKQDGCFEFCLLSEKQGGFDKESSEKVLVTHSGAHDARSVSEFDVVDEKPVPSNASLADSNQEVCLPSEKQGGFEKESSEKFLVTQSGADDARSLSELDVVDGIRDVDEKPVPSNASLADLNQEVCLPSEKQGGFEKESSETFPVTQSGAHDARSLSEFDVVDGFRDMSVDEKPVPSNTSLADLNQDILQLTKQFALLQELPDSLREELYNLLCEILDDGQTLAQIQAVVEEICLGSKPGLTFLNELKLPQKEYAQKILSLVGYDLQDKKLTEQSKDLIAAFHILTSALDEMPDSALTILGACCKLHLLPALCALPNITSDEGLCSRTEPLLSDLIDQGTFQIVQRLFSLSNMSLEMNEKNMRAETFKDPGFLPLILYIVLSGLHSLVKKN